jgi:predicted RNA-binding protein YlxR (DUF448 family)
MSGRRHIPQRTCVACRQVRPRSELLRVVRTPAGSVELDRTGKVAGRGAYVCDDARCLEQALKQRKLARALGTALNADVAGQIRMRVSGGEATALKGQASTT